VAGTNEPKARADVAAAVKTNPGAGTDEAATKAGPRVRTDVAAAVRADESPVEATAMETAAAVKAASTSREGRARGENHETDDRECSQQTRNFELLHDSTPFGAFGR
jgi:hypothetical protein